MAASFISNLWNGVSTPAAAPSASASTAAPTSPSSRWSLTRRAPTTLAQTPVRRVAVGQSAPPVEFGRVGMLCIHGGEPPDLTKRLPLDKNGQPKAAAVAEREEEQRKSDTVIARYPIDGETFHFGKDGNNDIRLYLPRLEKRAFSIYFDCTSHMAYLRATSRLKINGGWILPHVVQGLGYKLQDNDKISCHGMFMNWLYSPNKDALTRDMFEAMPEQRDARLTVMSTKEVERTAQMQERTPRTGRSAAQSTGTPLSRPRRSTRYSPATNSQADDSMASSDADTSGVTEDTTMSNLSDASLLSDIIEYEGNLLIMESVDRSAKPKGFSNREGPDDDHSRMRTAQRTAKHMRQGGPVPSTPSRVPTARLVPQTVAVRPANATKQSTISRLLFGGTQQTGPTEEEQAAAKEKRAAEVRRNLPPKKFNPPLHPLPTIVTEERRAKEAASKKRVKTPAGIRSGEEDMTITAIRNDKRFKDAFDAFVRDGTLPDAKDIVALRYVWGRCQQLFERKGLADQQARCENAYQVYVTTKLLPPDEDLRSYIAGRLDWEREQERLAAEQLADEMDDPMDIDEDPLPEFPSAPLEPLAPLPEPINHPIAVFPEPVTQPISAPPEPVAQSIFIPPEPVVQHVSIFGPGGIREVNPPDQVSRPPMLYAPRFPPAPIPTRAPASPATRARMYIAPLDPVLIAGAMDLDPPEPLSLDEWFKNKADDKPGDPPIDPVPQYEDYRRALTPPPMTYDRPEVLLYEPAGSAPEPEQPEEVRDRLLPQQQQEVPQHHTQSQQQQEPQHPQVPQQPFWQSQPQQSQSNPPQLQQPQSQPQSVFQQFQPRQKLVFQPLSARPRKPSSSRAPVPTLLTDVRPGVPRRRMVSSTKKPRLPFVEATPAPAEIVEPTSNQPPVTESGLPTSTAPEEPESSATAPPAVEVKQMDPLESAMCQVKSVETEVLRSRGLRDKGLPYNRSELPLLEMMWEMAKNHVRKLQDAAAAAALEKEQCEAAALQQSEEKTSTVESGSATQVDESDKVLQGNPIGLVNPSAENPVQIETGKLVPEPSSPSTLVPTASQPESISATENSDNDQKHDDEHSHGKPNTVANFETLSPVLEEATLPVGIDLPASEAIADLATEVREPDAILAPMTESYTDVIAAEPVPIAAEPAAEPSDMAVDVTPAAEEVVTRPKRGKRALASTGLPTTNAPPRKTTRTASGRRATRAVPEPEIAAEVAPTTAEPEPVIDTMVEERPTKPLRRTRKTTTKAEVPVAATESAPKSTRRSTRAAGKTVGSTTPVEAAPLVDDQATAPADSVPAAVESVPAPVDCAALSTDSDSFPTDSASVTIEAAAPQDDEVVIRRSTRSRDAKKPVSSAPAPRSTRSTAKKTAEVSQPELAEESRPVKPLRKSRKVSNTESSAPEAKAAPVSKRTSRRTKEAVVDSAVVDQPVDIEMAPAPAPEPTAPVSKRGRRATTVQVAPPPPAKTTRKRTRSAEEETEQQEVGEVKEVEEVKVTVRALRSQQAAGIVERTENQPSPPKRARIVSAKTSTKPAADSDLPAKTAKAAPATTRTRRGAASVKVVDKENAPAVAKPTTRRRAPVKTVEPAVAPAPTRMTRSRGAART